MYLLDTNVVSASGPGKPDLTADLVEWLDRNTRVLHMSVVTVAEIETGIAQSRRRGAIRKAERLAAWLDAVLSLYADRILPLDVGAARVAGRFADQVRAAGQAPGFPDLAIAATAARLDYVVLTRNLRHFQLLPIRCHDPFDSLPELN